jgi:hypothetical protein
MKEIKHNRHKIVIEDDISRLNIQRFQHFNRWLLMDSGIGSDLNAINGRLTNIMLYIKHDDKENALKEVANMSQAITFVMENINPEMGAFICLCESIDGVRVNDLSDEGIKKYIEILGRKDIPLAKIREWLSDAKKKLKKILLPFSRN